MKTTKIASLEVSGTWALALEIPVRNRFYRKDLGVREVVGGLALIDWYHVTVPYRIDIDEVEKFLDERTEGRYSIQSYGVRFEDQKDAVIFTLGFRL